MNKIKEIRESLNMTQEELASKSGVSRDILSRLENNKDVNLTKNTMISIAKALKSEVFDIFLF
ncbi:MAG: helix-turn-helix transcriptional regulator [Erysipelotrichaceae bacterium]|nr:helix-turn-helix transcriptional regulator [Erysipelotrichaceae bacterium]